MYYRPYDCAGHLHLGFSERRQTIRRCAERLEDIEFDTIVVTGLSGLLIGPSVADRMGKEIAVVRREGEHCHSARYVEGFYPDRYIILDDLSASGVTIKWVLDVMDRQREGAHCVGVLLYCENAVNASTQDALNQRDIPLIPFQEETT